MSKGELSYFYTLEWSLYVTDIREQWELPLEVTREVADSLGVAHPRLNGVDKTISSDFVLTVHSDGVERDVVRTYKPSDQIDLRELEKFEVERLAWNRMGVDDWGIVTEHEVNENLSRNVELIHTYRSLSREIELSREELSQAGKMLTNMIAAHPEYSLSALALRCDKHLGQKPGCCLAIAYHLIATRQWLVNMTAHRIDPTKPLLLLSVNLRQTGESS